jgi:hypothetical protein
MRQGMLAPTLANLFETLRVIRAATHAIHILRNGRVIIAGKGNQSKFTTPALHDVVPTPSPTKLPLLPPCSTEGRSPTITSGPGFVPLSGWLGITADCITVDDVVDFDGSQPR